MDLTQGPLGPLLLRLAWPVVVSMLLNQLLGVIDLLFVKRLGDTAATAAVGISTFATFLVINLLVGLGIGTSALVARRTGEGNQEAAQEVVRQSCYLMAVLSLVLGAGLALAADPMLDALGQSAAVRHYAVPFIQIYAGSFVIGMQTIVFRSTMQGLGDTLTPTLLLLLANGINALLDWLLVTGVGPFPRMEVAGLAVGTAVAQIVQVAIYLHLLRGGRYFSLRTGQGWTPGWRRYPYHLRFPGFQLLPDVLRGIWAIGWPTGMQGVLRSFAFLILMRFAGRTDIGDKAVAAFTAGMNAEGIAFLPVVGVSFAVVSLVGQNLGAGSPERAERAAVLGGRVAFLYLLVMCVVFLVWNEELIGLFLDRSDVQAIHSGAWYLYLTGFAEWSLYVIALAGALRASGDARFPFVVQMVGQYLLRLPLAWALLEYTTWDSIGLWVAVNVSMVLEALAIHWRFAQGKWKTKKI
ncbi:MAG TPA: MATE family efflux transporter [bacterium]|nr:MATE family efflux transporter [bacterium]